MNIAALVSGGVDSSVVVPILKEQMPTISKIVKRSMRFDIDFMVLND